MKIAFNQAALLIATGGLDFLTGVFRMLVLTEADGIDPAELTVADLLAIEGNTEVDDGVVTSYARELLAYTGTTNQAGSVVLEDADRRAEWFFDDVVFDLETGGPASPAGVLLYLDVEGDDSVDATAVPLFYWPTPAVDVTGLTVQGGPSGAVQVRAA